jgi:endonuclease YncB( thermonuclease family)
MNNLENIELLTESSDIELNNATWQNTIFFVPNVTYGKIIKVYDGDTITIVGRPYPASPVYRFSIRLSGINCPEIKSKNSIESTAAKIIQNKLEDLLLNQYVYLKNVSLDKYGRLLAQVWKNKLFVNQWLLDMNFATPYFGKKKDSSINWMDFIDSCDSCDSCDLHDSDETTAITKNNKE